MTQNQEWFLVSITINDLIDYASTPSNQIQIIVDIIEGVIINPLIVFALVIFCKPIYNFVVNTRKWWIVNRLNPNLEIEITLSGEIEPHIPKNFAPIMKRTLKSIHNYPIIHETGDVFKLDKRFADFDGNFRIIPVIGKRNYENIVIIFSTKGLKLKKLNRGIIELQNYLLGELVQSLGRDIRFIPDTNNEEVKVNFSEIPVMLQSIKELNINELNSEDNHTKIIIARDKIRFIGNIEHSIDKIEEIVRSNLSS